MYMTCIQPQSNDNPYDHILNLHVYINQWRKKIESKPKIMFKMRDRVGKSSLV